MSDQNTTATSAATQQSPLQKVESGLARAVTFMLNVFTKIDKVDAAFRSLEPKTKAAMLATFYDATQVIAEGAAAAGSAKMGDIPGTTTLSETTLTLAKTVVNDAKNDLAILKSIASAF